MALLSESFPVPLLWLLWGLGHIANNVAWMVNAEEGMKIIDRINPK